MFMFSPDIILGSKHQLTNYRLVYITENKERMARDHTGGKNQAGAVCQVVVPPFKVSLQ